MTVIRHGRTWSHKGEPRIHGRHDETDLAGPGGWPGTGPDERAAATASVSAPAQAVALAGDAPPGFWWGTDSFNGLRAGQGAVQHAVPRRRLRRLHRDDRELGVLAGLQRPGALPRLLVDQRRAGAHQLRDLPQGRRPRRVLVHGRPRRRPALERDGRRGLQVGRAAGGPRADRHRQRGRPRLPGRLDGHRATRHRARHRQRLEHRVHHAVQREGEAAAHPGEHRPRGLQRLLRLHHRALQVPARCLLRRRGVELDLRRQQRQPGQPRLHPAHRRVDLRAGDHQLHGQLPDRLLPEVGRVRAVLRRRHPVEQQRPHVAVVRRRRGRPTASAASTATSTRSTAPATPSGDPPGPRASRLSRRSAARAGCPGAPAAPGRAATCR